MTTRDLPVNLRRAAEVMDVNAVIEQAKVYGKPKPEPKAKKPRKYAKPRAILEKQLEDIVRLIVFWRDGSECIERHIDGARCGGGIQWGHWIPRQQSRWLKYDIGNTFAQCRNHNNLHDKGDQTMGIWFASTFGTDAAKELNAERDAHRGSKQRPTWEIAELITKYDELYQNRFYVQLDLPSLIAAGYYGEQIKNVWMKERITTP